MDYTNSGLSIMTAKKNPAAPSSAATGPSATTMGRGRANSVTYPLVLPKRIAVSRRYLFDVSTPAGQGGLSFSPTNPRLVTKLFKSGLAASQDNLLGFLRDECHDLVESLPITGGINSPIVISSKWEVEEGNRRLAAYRILYTAGLENFRFIPVEELPDDVTPGETRVLLAIRHIKSEKQWFPREQWRVIETMQVDQELTNAQIAILLEVTEDEVYKSILSKTWYDEFDAYSARQTTKSEVKDPDRLFSYFWKLAQKKAFREASFATKSERDRFYKYVHKGQFNDCLNIDRLNQYWAKPKFVELVESGVTYRNAVKVIDGDDKDRRGNNWSKEAKTLRNTLKKLRVAEKNILRIIDGATMRKELELLGLTIQALLVETAPIVQMNSPRQDVA